MHKVFFSAILFAIICLVSCREEKVYIPKPRIYPKIEFPERKMTNLRKDFCSFSFEHPEYMSFEQDTLFLHRDAPHSCWFNLKFPGLNGTVHFTYTDLKKCDTLSACLHKVYNDPNWPIGSRTIASCCGHTPRRTTMCGDTSWLAARRSRSRTKATWCHG